MQQRDVMLEAKGLLNDCIGELQNGSLDGVLAVSKRETQLTLWQLKKINEMKHQASDQLLRAEAKLQTDLDRLHMFGGSYVHPFDPRGAQLKDKLAQLEEKRSRLEMEFFDRQMRCLERLALIVGRHELLQQNRP